MELVRIAWVVLVASVVSAQMIQYSESEQIQFATERLYPIIKMVMNAQLSCPEINGRIKKQDELIRKRFGGKKITVNMRPSYNEISRLVPAASGILNGEPRIVLYIPAIMNNYVDNQSHWIRCIMHERDHLTEMKGNISKVDLELEIHMHALTTQFVTVPMKEKCGVVLSSNDQKHYNAWIRAGRSEKSPVWRDYIKTLLSPVLR